MLRLHRLYSSSISLWDHYQLLISTQQLFCYCLLPGNNKGFSSWSVNVESNPSSTECNGNDLSLQVCTGKWSCESAVCLSRTGLKDAEQGYVQHFNGGNKKQSDIFLTALQKRKKNLIFTCMASERFSFSPRQFVSLKAKKTINSVGQNTATESNRRFPSSYHKRINNQTDVKNKNKKGGGFKPIFKYMYAAA